MLLFSRRASSFLILLVLGTGCSSFEIDPPIARSAPSEAVKSPLSTPPPSATATAASLPDTTFEQAMNSAASAAAVAQSAISPEDWLMVGRQWQRAIALLSLLPTSHAQHAIAQQKIVEYRRNLAYAEGKAGQKIPPVKVKVAAKPRRDKTAKPSSRTVSRPVAANPRGNTKTDFIVMAGGGTPHNNEIALEKNVLYFQRTLQQMGYNPADASVFFANGNDGKPSIRYLDAGRQERFKVPEIPYLKGSSTLGNFENWLDQRVARQDTRPIFFYFTGHGTKNHANTNNNALILWQDTRLSVRQFANSLARLPQKTPVVTMMAQCYAGSFANFIYESGDPNLSVALQTRCGFFATIKTRTSVGCTPEVNEADYRDYSSSFFAGLSGRSRTGASVPSADYNRDGKVSYAEAHAFAKVDEQTTDLPVSTSEVWLQEWGSEADKARILQQPIAQVLKTARPEQQYVVKTLANQFGFNLQQSYQQNLRQRDRAFSEVQQAYLTRLKMELMNIGLEQQVRAGNNRSAIAILKRLLECEADFWQ